MKTPKPGSGAPRLLQVFLVVRTWDREERHAYTPPESKTQEQTVAALVHDMSDGMNTAVSDSKCSTQRAHSGSEQLARNQQSMKPLAIILRSAIDGLILAFDRDNNVVRRKNISTTLLLDIMY